MTLCYCEKPEEKNENKEIALYTVCEWLIKHNMEYQNSEETKEECEVLIDEHEAEHQKELRLLEGHYKNRIEDLQISITDMRVVLRRSERVHQSYQLKAWQWMKDWHRYTELLRQGVEPESEHVPIHKAVWVNSFFEDDY